VFVQGSIIMKFDKKMKDEIINRLKPLNVKKIILFGSYAYGKPDEYSDIDIVVVLNKNGITQTYKERLENRQMVSKKIIDLREKIPIDILTYTKDEWRIIENTQNSFFKNVIKEGIVLL